MARDVQQEIGETVKNNAIVLFMKGSRMMPQCGFSAAAVQILEGIGAEFKYVNVLEDPEVREGVKVYGQWPTIPQLYVGGELVGGSDIIQEMYAKGELKALVEKAAA